MSETPETLEGLAAQLADWIRAEIGSGGGHGAVFGMSGGIDSAVVAALCLRAYPRDSLGVAMPCHSDPADLNDALLASNHFGLPTVTVDLTPVYDTLLAQLGRASSDLPAHRTVLANLKPRLRMTTLYAFANQRDYRVVGTGNRSELAIGYFTKYGDGGTDLLPIGALTKTEVRELAEHLGVPRRIIDKPPSAGLWDGQTDEGEMGFTYRELDAYLLGGGEPPNERVAALVAASGHKRALPKVAPFGKTGPDPLQGGSGTGTTGPRSDR
jgi:NAD+ synthase